jgi:hypothetical protein
MSQTVADGTLATMRATINERTTQRDALAQALRNFLGFAEYHELEKANPRLQLQLLEMRQALAKAGL